MSTTCGSKKPSKSHTLIVLDRTLIYVFGHSTGVKCHDQGNARSAIYPLGLTPVKFLFIHHLELLAEKMMVRKDKFVSRIGDLLPR